MSRNAKEIYRRFLGREPDGKELDDLLTVGLGPLGYLWTDDRCNGEVRVDKPILLFYTSCHAEQMVVYLKQYRPDILDKFQWLVLYTHRLLLHRGKFNLDLIHAIFAQAHTIITNPMNPRFEELSTIPLLAKATGAVAKFVPPSVTAFWPVVEHFGEEPVARAMLAGFTADQIIAQFDSGTLGCCFGSRYEHQINRLRKREEDCHATLSGFIDTHHREHKLFFTSNHPTFPVIGHLMEGCLRHLGYAAGPEPLSLPMNAANFSHHFPETNYEWEYFRFRYPMRFPKDRGGSEFYRNAIRAICERTTDPAQVIANPKTPVEIEVT